MLSHRVVLQEFLRSGLETALILEDDVDFDIRLRSLQVPLAQFASRQLLHDNSSNYNAVRTRPLGINLKVGYAVVGSRERLPFHSPPRRHPRQFLPR